ncbi:MAG: hypothetical protein PCFJNLEI_02682 [Verrucomicrobiae bacterium]|nr:hypothetical protein [Verrucomicrobiae bacterium]
METRRKPRVSGFTLVELLVAVVIILVLFTLLLPARHSGEKQRRVKCLANLKRLGEAIRLYTEDNLGRCPADANEASLIGSMRLLNGRLSSAESLFCPSTSWGRALRTSDLTKLTTNNVSYSYVPNQIWKRGSPNAIIALDWISSTAAGTKWPSNSNHRTAGGNVLFNDGRVEWKNVLPLALLDKDGKETVLSP